jgi:hypothetical protein
MTHENSGDARAGHGPGYEVRDTNVRAIVIFLIGLTVMIVVVQIGLWGMLKSIKGEQTGPMLPLTSPEMITDQRKQLNTRENETLEGYGWVDKKKGAVRIPIGKAIDLLAEQGLPAPGHPPRTEVDVNSHSGTAAAPDASQGQEKAKGQKGQSNDNPKEAVKP